MNQIQEYLAAFLGAVGKTPELWASVDIRCIAIRVGEDWHNIVTRCRLDGRSPKDVPRLDHLPVTDMLVCRQMVIAIKDLKSFMQSMGDGRAEISRSEIAFLSLESSGPAPYSRGSVWIATDSTWRRDFERFPTAHRLTLYAGGEGVFRRASLDRESMVALVSTLQRPWDGLDSLTEYALGTTTVIDTSGTQTVEVVAPLEARIEHCELSAGTLSYVLAAGSQAVADRCTVGMFGVRPDGGILSESGQPARETWHPAQQGSAYRCTHSESVQDARRVSILLRVGPFLVDRKTNNDVVEVGQNTRVVSYAQFDTGLKRLTEVLGNPAGAKNEDEFHSIVARLFTLAGFSVDSFVADASLTGRGIPDFLAYAPHEGSLLVVECTTGPLASLRDKMSLLVGRARRVETALASGAGERVLPVIITAQAHVAPHELEAARRSRVAVLAQKDLIELLQLAQDQEPLRAILTWCQAHIPPKDPSAPLIPSGRVR